MGTEIHHNDLLSEAWPTATILVLAALSVAAWIGLHWLGRLSRSKVLQPPLFVVRCALGALSLWLICNGLSRMIVLATSWPIVGICVFCAITIEIVLALYHYERKFVSVRLGAMLAVLRVALVLTLGLMLLQPVLAWSLRRTRERFIAVLLDDSLSMHISDQQLTDSEKLRLLRVFDPSIAKPPYDLGSAVTQLAPLADRLGAAADALVQLTAEPDSNAGRDFPLRRQAIKDVVQATRDVASRQSERIADLLATEVQLKAQTREAAELLRQQLDSDVVARMVESDQLISQYAQDIEPQLPVLIGHLNGSAAAIREVVSAIPPLADAADRSYFASLPPEKINQAREILSRTRADIARALLLDAGGFKGLIGKIKEGYRVRLFRFNQRCNELDLEQWSTGDAKRQTTNVAKVQVTPVATTTGQADTGQADGADTAAMADQDADQDADRAVTDFAVALETARREIPSENLAGVLLVTDGRHNGPADVEAIVKEFGARKIPVSALVVGSSRPPVGAAIVDVDHPSTLLVDDLLAVKVGVKLTGMAGRSVRAKLLDGQEVLSDKTIRVTNDDFSSTIELAHTPKQEGFREYRVEIEPVEADNVESQAFARNNQRSFSVAVSDNRTEILIIEGRPRWEFGYLRNLFANRDVTVQLQTVLFEPDRLAQGATIPAVHASVSREDHQIEATLPPADETEWLKFDVIMLGDFAVDRLSSEQFEILHKFVSQRGGSIVVIAGPNYMPHRFANTRLAEMLPVEFEQRDEVLFHGPESQFEIRLTSVGRRQEVMRQADSVEASEAIWKSFPELYWRHAITGTKPGAAVLAYAASDEMPKDQQAGDDETPEAAEARRSRREQYQRNNALIAIHKYGLGRVMMVNTDRTWRMRYRVGDTYHHRFWGQVIRWATAQRLQAGTQFVQLGTDRIKYQVGDPVQVTAKITDSYSAPVEDKEAVIKVYRGTDLLITKSLEPVADAPGTFRVDLGKMPGHGSFRIELDSPEAKRIFAGDDDGPVETQITVQSPAVSSPELIDATADRAELLRLTSLSGGTVVEADSRNTVFDFFNEGSKSYDERRSFALWDTWPLLLLMVLLITGEWIFRKAGGLA